ncbi:MAG: response regulator transcription factor [Planctomycetota bacterium]|jgi:DNA-binding response OmpR family regulator
MAYLLIVEDDEDFASAIATALRSAGHEVDIQLDTENGLKSMRERKPDLLILDVMFPEDSSAGFNLARTVRHYVEELKELPVLMLTAVNSKFPFAFSTKDIDDHWLPVADFLEKPVDLEVLKKKVSSILEAAKSSPESA